jgi:flagellar basal-body rod protein FlgG
MYREINKASGILDPGKNKNVAGLGASVGAIQKIFTQGDMKQTGRQLDIAIQGNGFFEMLLPDGTYAYTRTGNFKIDKDGMLVNSNGFILNPSIQVPEDAESLFVESDGTFLAQVPGESQPIELGRMQLASFVNPTGLIATGDNMYIPSHESGDAYYADPSEDSAGITVQGFLEGSNVDLVQELTSLIVAQRGYEMSAKVIQASDDMMDIINNLRR